MSMVINGDLAVVPFMDNVEKSRQSYDGPLRDIQRDIDAYVQDSILGEDGWQFQPMVDDEAYKEAIYDEDWAVREVDEITFFFRRLGVGTFVALYVIFANRWSDRVSGKIKLPTIYDPEKIEQYFKLRPETVAFRSFQIGFEALQLGIGAFWDNFNFNLSKDLRAYQHRARKFMRKVGIQLPVQQRETLEERHRKEKEYWDWRYQRRAAMMRSALSRLGPAFVKFGQLLASRPDIVGPRLMREFQRLQDDIPFFGNDAAFQFVREELGADPDRIFQNLTKTPICAASLGQVYKAELEGVPIAVKVQRPGMADVIALDFYLLRAMAKLLRKYTRSKSDPALLVDDFGLRLFEELDYVRESKNMARFKHLYGNIKGIYIPKVFTKYSTAHVLTMEWVEGQRLITDSASVKLQDVPLVEAGIRCCLTQMLDVGFLHADPHAGNLIRTQDGQLAYLDFGLMSTIPDNVRDSFLITILHLINREYELLAEDFASMSIIQAYEMDLELAEFSKALMDEFEPLVSGGTQNFTFIGITEKLLSLANQFPLVLPSYFVGNMRALATLEGLALTADPDFRIFRLIYPYVVNRVLYGENPTLKAALTEMVVDREGSIRWDRLTDMVNDADEDVHILENEGVGTSINSISKPHTVVDFITSPGGRQFRQMLKSQLLDDLNFRFQRALDGIESMVLPSRLRPPARCIGACTDAVYMIKLKENRKRLLQLLKKLLRLNVPTILRLTPLILLYTGIIIANIVSRLFARMLRDVLFILMQIVRGNSNKAAVSEPSLNGKRSAGSTSSTAAPNPTNDRTSTFPFSSILTTEEGSVFVTSKGVAEDRLKGSRFSGESKVSKVKQNGTPGNGPLELLGKSVESNGVHTPSNGVHRTSNHNGEANGVSLRAGITDPEGSSRSKENSSTSLRDRPLRE
eukprot:CAMPEP_0184751782 /NCGR_PEP_ID=MMETSP0315-20130426/43229_1 /TAXON_ID=101924 /ORGANISM="Rhodosorus marinus, Strain UTEX LB 2760" /LENGTH=916 /DNA_ID=CAMNT_0027231069 /DNA_START=350 /DNA_END=3100 /DNA_ORIENTATION=-